MYELMQEILTKGARKKITSRFLFVGFLIIVIKYIFYDHFSPWK